MTQDEKPDAESPEEDQSRKGKVGESIKQGMGMVSAFKDALEETIQEARDRGDLSSERAKELVKDALDRAQAAAEGARDRFDFVHQSDMEALQSAVESIRTRVSSLEASVFSESKANEG